MNEIIQEDGAPGLKIKTDKCLNSLRPSYTYQKWPEKFNKNIDCITYYNLSEKYQLFDYLNPPDKDNLLILVNGYRILTAPGEKWWILGVEYPTPEPIDAINTCFNNYENGEYWGETGKKFVKRINKNVIYLDGHHSIVTSNHRLMASNDVTEPSFAASYATCLLFCPFTNFGCSLNTHPNGDGFHVRYWNGREAGWEIWNKMVNGSIDIALSADKTQITGKIDVVAHSMGYAYGKGVLDVLQQFLAPGNTFGNYYIIAPENARAYTEEEFDSYSYEIQQEVVVDLGMYESVFQYGSDFNPGGDPKCKQDGVAPQARVRGLPNNNDNNIFIPDSEEKIKSFRKAHSIDNYGWVFDRLEGQKGFIKPRN